MAEEQAQLEMEMEADTEVEVESPEQETESEKVEVVQEDQFEKAESSTQKRIDRLTKKMREAQRREEEAINYAKQVQDEAAKLKQRFSALDSNYVTEYSNRVSTQMEQTEKELARAMELGDTAAVVEANKKMIALSAENERANQAKLAQERQQQQAQQQQAAPQQMQAAPQQQIKRPDQKLKIGLLEMSGLGRTKPKLLQLLAYIKSSWKTKGLTPRAMSTILSLIAAFPTRLEVKRKAQANDPLRRLQAYQDLLLGAAVGKRLDSPLAKSQSRKNWVCR